MCSGCSGDYAGDFEDSGEPTGESGNGDWPAWISGGEERNGNSLERRGFEAPACWGGNPQWGNSPSANGKTGEEIFEIIVSATRIVEIRVIAANPGETTELRKAQAAGNLARDKHSQASSAKYYQTRSGVPEDAADRIEVAIFCRLAASLLGGFRKWSGWARNALGKPRSQEFHRV